MVCMYVCMYVCMCVNNEAIKAAGNEGESWGTLYLYTQVNRGKYLLALGHGGRDNEGRGASSQSEERDGAHLWIMCVCV